jgi:hypothetical protein
VAYFKIYPMTIYLRGRGRPLRNSDRVLDPSCTTSDWLVFCGVSFDSSICGNVTLFTTAQRIIGQNGLQIWGVASNVLNNSRGQPTKGRFASLWDATETYHVTKCYRGPRNWIVRKDGKLT